MWAQNEFITEAIFLVSHVFARSFLILCPFDLLLLRLFTWK